MAPPAADSTASEKSDTEGSPPPQSRSRSQSRRARRRKQSTNKDAPKTPKGKQQPNMKSVPEDQEQEADDEQEDQAPQPQAQAQSGASAEQGGNQQTAEASSEAKAPTVEDTGMQPFEWIGPDETSMSGPVTYAKAQRGEIPARPGNPQQKLATADDAGESDMMKQDGLKLRLELNLDIELELKARIRGDLTLALLA